MARGHPGRVPLLQCVREESRKNHGLLRDILARHSSIEQYYQQIRDLAMHGSIAHSNPDTKAWIDRWNKDPLSDVAHVNFVKVMAPTNQEVQAVAEVNMKALDELP
jgi:hypothetical protein